jgi:4-hydroxy-4-methyl-2-oxoglutarate aldolase
MTISKHSDEVRLERLRALDTCAVSDALDSLEHPGAVVGITSLSVPRRVAGRAVTVSLIEADGSSAPRHLGTAAVDASGPGSVIVVAHAGRLHVAGWGGVLSAGAVAAGVEAVVVDGAVRDLDEAVELALPLYAAASVPITARGRIIEREWGVPINFAGVEVAPGDYVIADRSGVVFVPHGIVDEVLVRAEKIVARERAMVQAARGGAPMIEVMTADYETMLTKGALQ